MNSEKLTDISIAEILRKATTILDENEVSNGRREAVSLLVFVLKKDQTFLISHSDDLLTKEQSEHFFSLVTRRAKREPFQHISGVQEFYGLEFIVNKNVLIPRPETEILVEKTIEILREKSNARFCEIGIGSGCISISILHELKNISAIATDISTHALQIASLNSGRHRVSSRLELLISDCFSKINDNKKFDIIVSNPPYIDTKDFTDLQTEVRDYEPKIALTDGFDGLSIIKKIIIDSPKFLNPKGSLLIEIGFGQSEKVFEFAEKQNIWQSIDFLPDLQKIPRIAVLKL